MQVRSAFISNISIGVVLAYLTNEMAKYFILAYFVDSVIFTIYFNLH